MSKEGHKSNEVQKSKYDPESKAQATDEALESNKTYQWLRTITRHLNSFTSNLGIQYLIVGICAQVFFEERLYVFIFGLICSLQIIIGCLLYFINTQTYGTNFLKHNSIFFLTISLLNLVWIVAAVILFLVYKLWMTNAMFENDIVFQLSLFFYVLAAVLLAISYFLIIRILVQIKDQNKAQPLAQIAPSTVKSKGKLKTDGKEEKDKKNKMDKKKGSNERKK